jgi:hypothetical protein
MTYKGVGHSSFSNSDRQMWLLIILKVSVSLVVIPYFALSALFYVCLIVQDLS